MPNPRSFSLDAFAKLLEAVAARKNPITKQPALRAGNTGVVDHRVRRNSSGQITSIELELEHAADPLVLTKDLARSGDFLIYTGDSAPHIFAVWDDGVSMAGAGSTVPASPADYLQPPTEGSLVDLIVQVAAVGHAAGISARVYGRPILMAAASTDGQSITVFTERQIIEFTSLRKESSSSILGKAAGSALALIELYSERRNSPLSEVLWPGTADPRLPLDSLSRLVVSHLGPAPGNFKAHIDGALVIGVETCNTPKSDLVCNPAPHLGVKPWMRLTTRDQSIFIGECLAAGDEHLLVSVLDQTGGAKLGPRAQIHFVGPARPLTISDAWQALALAGTNVTAV